MPSNLPSSFASAAAGQNREGRGANSGEWSRTGRLNGTQIFRRASTTPSQSISSQTPLADLVQPPATMLEPAPRKYTREQLLAIFDSVPATDVSSLFVQGWNPGHVNGSATGTATRGWGKNVDTHVQPQEPDQCWDPTASTRASNLRDLSPDERELFSTDVNSPVKPPPQNKDGNALNGRKTSVSQGASNNFGLASPSSASRPGTRRRETTDTNPYSGGGGGLMSPTASRGDGGSFWQRKNTEAKDSMYEEPEEDTNPREAPAGQNPSLPFGGLVRNNTSGAGGLATSSSLWGQPAPSPTTASGLGSFGNFALPASSAIGDKRPGGAGGQSRLQRLIPKDSSDSMGARGSEPSSAVDPRGPWRSRQRTDTDPFAAEENLSGSAVLGGAQDTSPPPMPRGSMFDTPVKGSAADFGMSGLNLGSQAENEPLSPSETNPYRSPPGERGENDEAGERLHGHGHGLGAGGSEHPPAFGGAFPRAFGQNAFDGSDRSQTSSVGANKPHPHLSNLTGWPSSATPDRERNPFGNAFGSSLFGPMGDLHSPSLGNLGGVFGPSSTTGLPGSGSISRGSKLGSLFPAAMQSQMQGHDTESLTDSVPDLRQINPLGAIGRNAFGDQHRDTESPMRAGRGPFSDMFGGDPSQSAATSGALSSGIPALSQGQGFPQSTGTPFSVNQSSEPPSTQARSMVMPDRMRWVYLDPQGQQQGPFTGLEMNDWYKGNFFTTDLRVKRVEDAEFEPLGQLIRRIGNSREPFLVPMMGIPHGPPSQSGPFSPNPSGVVQPPLLGAFPSFGRTLTAQEQNDLERRKQEEQYLMAQQRDILSNQPRLPKFPIQSHPGLHHHSSAHSLQSQPSFGSINSPITMPPQAPIGSVAGNASFLGGPPQQPHMGPGGAGPSLSDIFREEELARLSAEERQVVANIQGPGAIGSAPQPPVGSASLESFRSRLPGTQELVEDEEGFRGRLEEFEQLRAQHEAHAEQTRAALDPQSPEINSSVASPSTQPAEAKGSAHEVLTQKDNGHTAQEAELISASRQLEQAQAAAQKAGLPMPFPPPQSSTPLPAPAPQRIKSNLPEQYASSSRSETPEITPLSAATQPPPLAPWAKDPSSESHRGPSLKEIQEAEAKKAAKREEALAASRRAAAEQEAAREREKAATLATGLPTSSTWGTSSPAAATSPWVTPTATKAPAPGLTAASTSAADKKKTLADIQREEEARKSKARDVSGQPSAGSSAGKRYADLASKPNATPVAGAVAGPPAAGWATVGAGGKVKIPTGPAAQSRSASSTNVKPVAAASPPVRPVIKSANSSTSRTEAMDEFIKWVQGQLSRGGVADVDGYTDLLNSFPLDVNTIADTVYSISKTMHGQQFGTEYVRRKKLAEKGVVEKRASDSPVSANTGGWNEVAKKNPHKENGDPVPSGFKVVPARKKGAKK
ncbi:uncharacterized protein JN550_011200 [Neoarthrinium moseri]|uniref:uncharacterized protein n=1 Tax=Neoarthrinium moseri TaxID=1658444 RepID=UPI001FDDB168|nr:uncharacterized protein JN550_011200 [Neoarthrinium moseri]KAI1860885.1 hypothetical protein JN550_011200 [Neoarthrinium moseri]